LDGRVFNAYHFGGYLIWRRWPANQVIIDGRYDAILFDEALLESYKEAHRSARALDRITTTYRIDLCVVDTQPGDRVEDLGRHPAWARVYWDPVAEVFVRRKGRFARIAAEREFRLTRPEADSGYLIAYRGDPDTWKQAVAELRRAAEDNPENVMAWLGLAQEYRAAGPGSAEQRLEALTRAEALMSGSPALGRVLGEQSEALLQLGRTEEATVVARQALRVQAEQVLPRSVLASVAEQRGAWAEVREHLQGILDRLQPDDPRASGIRERLAAAERATRGLGPR
jgi:tetratricopeptide (TPR) repeat protein